jgi:trehalose-phosphatase
VTTPGLDASLVAALSLVAAGPTLLVASDYDGTLAPIVDDPARALPDPDCLRAIEALSSVPGVAVGVITGRSLADLERLAPVPANVHRIGSHGAERAGSPGVGAGVDAARTRVIALGADLERAVGPTPGVLLEVKPTGVAVHVRRASRPDAVRVLDAVRALAATDEQLHAREGKEVVEISVVDVDKGRALAALRDEVRCDAVVFVGDDVTDEDAFAVLEPGDVGIKVGPGPSRAGYRVASTREVALAFELILARRRS